nr:hypothetical protein Iba_chr12dCG13940 [Ipomoea batatas]
MKTILIILLAQSTTLFTTIRLLLLRCVAAETFELFLQAEASHYVLNHYARYFDSNPVRHHGGTYLFILHRGQLFCYYKKSNNTECTTKDITYNIFQYLFHFLRCF